MGIKGFVSKSLFGVSTHRVLVCLECQLLSEVCVGLARVPTL